MPLAGAPPDLYTQLLACSSSQGVIAIACCLHASLCFAFCLLAVSDCTMTTRQTNNSLAASLDVDNSLSANILHTKSFDSLSLASAQTRHHKHLQQFLLKLLLLVSMISL